MYTHPKAYTLEKPNMLPIACFGVSFTMDRKIRTQLILIERLGGAMLYSYYTKHHKGAQSMSRNTLLSQWQIL